MSPVTEPESPAAEAPPAAAKDKKEEGSFAWFLVKLVIAVLLFRTLLFTSFSIPSASMMPRLLEGDFLFAAKWPYGYSQASMPFDMPIGEGRWFASLPERGDVVIFKHPVDRADYVKRVIGLPGDQVQMVAGVLHLNGQPVPKQRVADFVVPIRATEGCRGVQFTAGLDGGCFVCRYPQSREALPGGARYNGLALALQPSDTTPPIVVPEGRLFLMGDNRDNSLDSRFPAVAQQGIGL